MTLRITLNPTPSGKHVLLHMETEDQVQTLHLGYDALFDRVTEHINNKLRPMVNKVADEAKLARAKMVG